MHWSSVVGDHNVPTPSPGSENFVGKGKGQRRDASLQFSLLFTLVCNLVIKPLFNGI